MIPSASRFGSCLVQIGWVRLTCLGPTCEWVARNSEFPEHWGGRRAGEAGGAGLGFLCPVRRLGGPRGPAAETEGRAAGGAQRRQESRDTGAACDAHARSPREAASPSSWAGRSPSRRSSATTCSGALSNALAPLIGGASARAAVKASISALTYHLAVLGQMGSVLAGAHGSPVPSVLQA